MTNFAAEYERLRSENKRLLALLEQHGIQHTEEAKPTVHEVTPTQQAEQEVVASQLTIEEKITLFRRLFKGRTDVYPLRWESQKTGKSGYSPVCNNEWRPGVCHKPRVKCGECNHRDLAPLTEQAIYKHLAGDSTIGVYPMLPDETCHFLAADFDKDEWKSDALAFTQSCRELGVPAALEISRSGNGAHVWIFFSEPILARDARRLGAAIISHTCSRNRQLEMKSYDRLFPNQDNMPKGGFGNLIALPLQKKPREQGHSVFVDDHLTPFPDQWAYLASLTTLSKEQLESAILLAVGGSHPLDVSFISEEDQHEPWKRPAATRKISVPLPERMTITVANQLYFEKANLPQPLANRLIRLAAFQNPEFYKTQAMRMSVWDTPRIIGCAENYPKHIALPRGCLDAVMDLMRDNKIAIDIQDERYAGEPLDVSFIGTLRTDQETAARKMLEHDIGVLCAPTAFGKTVTAAAIIAQRKMNTLILVHRTELMKQWQERLQTFLGLDKKTIGLIGGGKHKPTGKIDIAVMQSLTRKEELSTLIESYGHVIVDECHHLSASSFESILKQAKARYVLGLTATPIRRDGQQPIIFMQCGPIRHRAARTENATHTLEVIPRYLDTRFASEGSSEIQDVFRQIAADPGRNELIAADVLSAYANGRRVIVLTERTEHLELLQQLFLGKVENLFVIHGRMPKKQRATLLSSLEALSDNAPRILLATGRLIGEGFDHPPLDTLALAMPISWTGTLQQYAGRLHRDHATKSEVRVFDYVDTTHPMLMRMWEKRQRGYKTMGYSIGKAQLPSFGAE
jgi:superfamily II DNA or RNA helicase